MQQPTPLEKGDLHPALEQGIKNQLQENDNKQLIANFRHRYHLDWKVHSYWVLAIICFILARLWWLVPLPGADFLPSYRTYPANFFNTLFLTIGCAFATRSLTVALVKTFENGVRPASVVAFGETGGFGAMFTCVRNRSGLRYFFIASLVTAAILLGNLLEGELQSSVMVYYKAGTLMDMNLVECRHSNDSDYEAASLAYQQGRITHTLSDAERLLNASHQYDYFGVSVIQTTLTPIDDIIMKDATAGANTLRKRHWHHSTTTCVDYEESGSNNEPVSTVEATPVTPITVATTVSATPTASNTMTAVIPGTTVDEATTALLPSHVPGQQQGQQQISNSSMTILSLYDEQIVINNTATRSTEGDFSGNVSSNLIVYKSMGTGGKLKALPYPLQQQQQQQSSNATAILSAIRHTTYDGKEAILIYPSITADAQLAAGVFVSAVATNYTCQPLTGCVMISTEPIPANNKVVADALLAAIQSGRGLYGTSTFDALTLAVVNRDPRIEFQGALADALFNNLNCPESDLLPTQGYAFLPYTAAHWTILGIIWIALYVILWAIGAYLIGLSEETWSQIATTGRMITLVINNSPSLLFTNNNGNVEPVDKDVFLALENGTFGYIKVHNHNHGFELSEVELPEEEGRT